MSWDNNVNIDWDELDSVLKLMPSGPTAMDIHMTFSTSRAAIEGEGNDPTLIPILGYAFKAQRLTSGNTPQSITPSPLWIVRNADSATASFLSAMITPGSGNSYADIRVKVFRSGEVLTGASANPMIQFIVTNGAIGFHSIVTCGTSGSPLEVMAIGYREIEICTAPQMASGIRGAVRSARFSQP
jgi:hypothetical protein